MEFSVNAVDRDYLLKLLWNERYINWYSFGLELIDEENHSILEDIKRNFSHDSWKRCVTEVICKWIDQDSEVSYHSVVYGLKNTGKIDLAKRIAKEQSKFNYYSV